MANKPISTAPITMGKHGRMHEAEAERAKGVTFTQKGKEVGSVTFGEPHPAKAAKPVEKKPEAARLNGPMLMPDLQAALSDKYPHNDIQPLIGETLTVLVPGGFIFVRYPDVNKCTNTAELRAYIDALPIL